MLWNEEVRKQLLHAHRIVTDLLLDETSRLYPQQLSTILFHYPSIEKVVCIGDRQPPPFGTDDKRFSIFDVGLQFIPTPIILNTTFRLPKPISKIISETMYDAKLTAFPLSPPTTIEECLGWIDIKGAERGNRRNQIQRRGKD